MVRPAISNTLVASVPVTEVGPAATSRGGSCPTATPAPPATTSRASRSTRSWRRTTGSAVPGRAEASSASGGQPAEHEHADPQRQQVRPPGGRSGPAGRQVQRPGRRTAAVGGPAGGVEPLARGRVLPGRVAAVVLAAGQEAGVLDRQAGRAHRPARGAGRRVHREVVGGRAPRGGVVLPAVALALVVPPEVQAVVPDGACGGEAHPVGERVVVVGGVVELGRVVLVP